MNIFMKNRPDFVELLFKRRRVARIHALDESALNDTINAAKFLGGFETHVQSAFHEDHDGDGNDQDKFYVYVGDKWDDLFAAVEADRNGDHQTLGELFGYPKCCIKRFVQYAGRKTADADNFWKPAVRDARKWPTYGDHLGGQFHYKAIMSPDLDVLSFFPCSFGCQDATKAAEFRWVLKDREHANPPSTIVEIDGTHIYFDIHMGA